MARGLPEARMGNPPDGPVELWFFVFATDGSFMGAAQARQQPSWLWRDGRLCCDYSPVRVSVQYRGMYATALICAVAGDRYRPLWPLSLGEPQELRSGDNITIANGVISLIPELPGPHG